MPDLSPHGYRVISELGRGGFGRVYLAHSEKMNRQVAIKELLPRDERTQSGERLSTDAYNALYRRFKKESEIAGGFGNSPYIVTVHDFIDPQYLVLHYYEGGTLRARLNEMGVLPLDEALVVAIGLCHALEEIWRAHIVHRDVKPDNIFLVLKRRDDGSSVITRAVLADFGIVQTPEQTSHRVTIGSKQPGTPDYKSPEQENDLSRLDVRSDLYAVGLVLYEMLYGQRYMNSTHYLRSQRVPDEEHAYVGSIVNKLLQKEPEARYSMPEDLRLDLEQVQQGRRPSTAPPAPPAPRRGGRLAAVAALLLVALLAGLVFAYRGELEAAIAGATPTTALVVSPTRTQATTVADNSPGGAGPGGVIATLTPSPEPTAAATATSTASATPTATPTTTPAPTDTATPTLTPSVTPTAVPKIVITNVPNQAFCRTGPGTFYPKKTPDLPIGMKLLATAADDFWYHAITDDGRICWVSKSNTAPDPESPGAEFSLAALPPPATRPPTPTPTYTPTPIPPTATPTPAQRRDHPSLYPNQTNALTINTNLANGRSWRLDDPSEYLGGYIHVQNETSFEIMIGHCYDDDGNGRLDVIEIYGPSSRGPIWSYVICSAEDNQTFPIPSAGPGYYWLYIRDTDTGNGDIPGNEFGVALKKIQDTILYRRVP